MYNFVMKKGHFVEDQLPQISNKMCTAEKKRVQCTLPIRTGYKPIGDTGPIVYRGLCDFEYVISIKSIISLRMSKIINKFGYRSQNSKKPV
jgi:hypothetical protein